MSLTAAEVISRARDLLQDPESVRWPQAELLGYVNDARREVAIARPDLYATTSSVSLAAGTKQSLPADGMRLMDVTRNMPSGVAGRAIRVVEREILDAHRPTWHTDTASTVIKHFMYDERTPRVFHVYPPATAGHQVEVVYGRTPADITSTATALTDEGMYVGAIVDYVCYRAFAKDAEYAGNASRAMTHYQQFLSVLGLGGKVGKSVSANVANQGGMPPRGN